MALKSGRAALMSVGSCQKLRSTKETREVESRKIPGDVCRARGFAAHEKIRGASLECGSGTHAQGSVPVRTELVCSVLFLRKEIACTKPLFGFQMRIEVGGIARFEKLKIYILSLKK